MVRGIFCLNSSCKHYFEDSCMHIFQKDTVSIDEDGKCTTFEIGVNEGYQGLEQEEDLN